MAKEKISKNKKNNGRSFNADLSAELKKVVWPTSKQMVNNVVAVLTIVIITALIVFFLDFAFGSMNTYGINKLKEKVAAKNNTTQTITSNTTEQNQNAQSNNNETQGNTENTSNNEAEATQNAETAD